MECRSPMPAIARMSANDLRASQASGLAVLSRGVSPWALPEGRAQTGASALRRERVGHAGDRGFEVGLRGNALRAVILPPVPEARGWLVVPG